MSAISNKQKQKQIQKQIQKQKQKQVEPRRGLFRVSELLKRDHYHAITCDTPHAALGS